VITDGSVGAARGVSYERTNTGCRVKAAGGTVSKGRFSVGCIIGTGGVVSERRSANRGIVDAGNVV